MSSKIFSFSDTVLVGYPLAEEGTEYGVDGNGASHYDEQQLVDALGKSFAMYKQHGARSPKKLKPIHQYIAEVLAAIWGKDFSTRYLGAAASEMTVSGKYYPKDIDITVTHGNQPVFCLGIKFVTSNYKQNANNYFEGMMGETANIQALGDLPYAQLLILRHQTPYYPKNETLKPKKIEVINDKDMQKYLKLAFDISQAHRPLFMGIQIIDLDEKTGAVTPTVLEGKFAPPIVNLLEQKLSLKNLFADIAHYKNYCSAKTLLG
ncbi:hypothetical protein FACS1894107_10260 [Planctomycetales bacterium]|nr:hypothetical protein FACS1894107_10260 [Planctomycetales bacterium]GHT01293.1 hypothetical protein FACS1894108_14840 [Planctomycetales bacterium]